MWVKRKFNSHHHIDGWPHLLPEIIYFTLTNTMLAQTSAEVITAALANGANIVLAGHTTDTAVISTLPVKNGDHAGDAWHGPKIAECSAFCLTNPASVVILVEFDESWFSVKAMAEDAICTPHSLLGRLLRYWRSHEFETIHPFFCQVEAVVTATWLSEVAPKMGRRTEMKF